MFSGGIERDNRHEIGQGVTTIALNVNSSHFCITHFNCEIWLLKF